jgi:hypothetical protein
VTISLIFCLETGMERLKMVKLNVTFWDDLLSSWANGKSKLKKIIFWTNPGNPNINPGNPNKKMFLSFFCCRSFY